MNRSAKAARQRFMRDIIAHEEIRTQEEVAARLSASGVRVTQATISRDLVELGVIRVPTDGHGLIYALPDHQAQGQIEGARRRLPTVLTTVAGNVADAAALLVYRTPPGVGLASMVAAAIDACHFPEIVGTVAGDDTIIIALRHPDDRALVLEKLTQ